MTPFRSIFKDFGAASRCRSGFPSVAPGDDGRHLCCHGGFSTSLKINLAVLAGVYLLFPADWLVRTACCDLRTA